jgi:hypothetical protein
MAQCPAKNDRIQKKSSQLSLFAAVFRPTKKYTYRFARMISRQQKGCNQPNEMPNCPLSMLFKVVVKEPHPNHIGVACGVIL